MERGHGTDAEAIERREGEVAVAHAYRAAERGLPEEVEARHEHRIQKRPECHGADEREEEEDVPEVVFDEGSEVAQQLPEAAPERHEHREQRRCGGPGDISAALEQRLRALESNVAKPARVQEHGNKQRERNNALDSGPEHFLLSPLALPPPPVFFLSISYGDDFHISARVSPTIFRVG